MKQSEKPSHHFFRSLQPLNTAARALLLSILVAFAGCDRMVTPRNAQIVKDADAKAAQGDYLRAINLYEAALDDTPRCAEIHYKLALLYDDKMNDPLNALHHFKRYLTLNPNGTRANEVKGFMKSDEIALLTNLSGDSLVTRAEATRLRNENLNLRKEIEERSSKLRGVADKSQIRETSPEGTTAKKSGNRTYVVQRGDTLFSISRKFYKSVTRWKEIRDANKKKIDDPAKLEPGEILTIP
jgi:tetratricopeptide (TPR) repeat protein